MKPQSVMMLAGLVMASLLVGTAASAQAAQPTYDEFSRISVRSAGQYWADGQVAGQWAWNPQSAGESRISWGDPAKWPPDYAETFIRRGDWLLLDGWSGNGTYYKLNVTRQLIGDGTCHGLRPLPGAEGRQRYVRWTIPDQPYCLKAWGVITEESSGKTVDFSHTQIWSPPQACSNPHYGAQTCIKQWESWWDNNGSPGTPITRKLDRDVSIARGIGMAFAIRQSYPSSWRADLRYHWNWGRSSQPCDRCPWSRTP
jgi:hypothetical protein